ncbi:hypothetical protein MJT46_016154 [Ovis ammon polii x Ovis aries]|nr:hypothetical protein MJT46_016154 [Ovis ammon polii x Ovis aries]
METLQRISCLHSPLPLLHSSVLLCFPSNCLNCLISWYLQSSSCPSWIHALLIYYPNSVFQDLLNSTAAGVQTRWIQGDSKVGTESASLEKCIFNHRYREIRNG